MKTIESIVWMTDREPDPERGSVLVEFDVADGTQHPTKRRYSVYVVTLAFLTDALSTHSSLALGRTSPLVVVRRIDDASVRQAVEDLLPRADELAKRVDIGVATAS